MAARPKSVPLQVALGAVVRAERHRLGWSQEKLAEAAALNRAYVTELECGRRTPNLATLVRLAAALGMALSGLLAAAEEGQRRR